MKKFKKSLCLLFAFALVLTSVQLGGIAGMTTVEADSNTDYEIYPTPHKVVYGDNDLTFTDEVHVVFENGIDDPTKNKVKEVLALKGLTSTESAGTVSGKTNILVGINGSNGVADQFVKANAEPEAGHFDKIDAYVLTAKENTIAITGKDTTAAFYGLATLKMIVNQIADKTVRNLTITDYSDSEWRGFIEGYYGLPWSNEDRKSLMEFGGDLKANAYIFAPKDDPYHNKQWRDPYPKEILEEIKELAAVGNKTKCEFVWTIHPFMTNPISTSNYAESMAIIKEKFQSLYKVGVRRFGVLADDAGAGTNQLVIDMLNDLTDWCNEKGDVGNMVYCPTDYNTAFAGGSFTRLQELNKMNDQVNFFWTGEGVCYPVTKKTVEDYKKNLTTSAKEGREPLFWLNWPVNDINGKRMLMGKGEMLRTEVEPGTLKGVITNPMQQAEPSKVAIFAVADYAWNIKAFDEDKSWEDSFKYIEPDASDALYTMAKHMSDPKPNGHGLVLQESEELAEKLEAFTALYRSGASVKTSGTDLIQEFQTIVAATKTFDQDTKNENMKTQLAPWTNSLRLLADAAINFIQTAISIEEEDNEAVWSNYSIAASDFAASKKCLVHNKDLVENVEAGAKRLIPFVSDLSGDLGPKVNKIVNPDGEEAPIVPTLIKSGISGIYKGNDANVTDNDDTTYAWYQTTPNDSLPANGYIGLDLGQQIHVGQIKILQGNVSGEGANDIIPDAVVEYSLDGQNYTEIESFNNVKDIHINASNLGIQARYIRLKAKSGTNKWLMIREISVTIQSDKVDTSTIAYTNVPALSRRAVESNADTASMAVNDREITLKGTQYLGITLPRIRDIIDIQADYTNTDKLSLEASLNGVEWTPVNQGELSNGQAAKYIRIINKGEAPVSFQLNKFIITSDEVFPIRFLESNIATRENPDHAFDGDKTTKAWFKASQAAGQYIIYDLGQSITIDKLKFCLSDGEVDFIRNADISVSSDKANWTSAITIGDLDADPASVGLADVYDNEVPYYTKSSASGLNIAARYIKLEITKDYGDRWIRFNEIEINDGKYRPVENNPTYDTSDIEARGHQPSYLMDGDVNTTYQSSVENGSGYLTYRVSENTNITDITLLQSPGTISNAVVSVRHSATEWADIGILSSSLNKFENLDYDNIFEIKIAWDSIAPTLHEMFLTAEDNTVINPVDKTELNAKYYEALEIEEQYYTPATYAVLYAAMQDAEGIIGYAASTEEDVREALTALTAALDGLEEITPDPSALEAKLEEAKGLVRDIYTADSYAALEEAIAEAEELLESGNASQAQLDVQLAALAKAMDALIFKGTLIQIPSNELSAAAGSEENSGTDGGASAAIDGDESTYWHSNWSGGADFMPDIPNNIRNEFTIDVGETRILRKLTYVPRSGSVNGRITQYKLYYSQTASGDDFKEIPDAEGTWEDNTNKKEVLFQNVRARRIQIRALATRGDSGNDKFISAAEFYVSEIIPDEPSETKYTAAFAGNGGTGTAPVAISAAAGTLITLPANTFTRDGFTFEGWNDGSETYAAGSFYTMPERNVSFEAQWNETKPTAQYTASFSGNDAEGIAPADMTAEAGASITLPANTFTKAGYTFTAWNDGTENYQPNDSYEMPAHDVTFTAVWEALPVPNTYTVSFDGNGGSGTIPDRTLTEGQAIGTLPVPTRNGYEFTGWFTAKNGGIQVTAATTVTADTTIYAQWKQIVNTPDKVTGLKASKHKTKSIKLTWKKGSNATAYEVYRYNANKKTWKNIKTVTSTSFTNSGLKVSTAYKYKVRAINQIGQEMKAGSFSSVLKTATAPAKPAITYKKSDANKVVISWKKDAAADGVELYMKTGKKPFKLLKLKGKKAVSFTTGVLKKGTTYRFKLRRFKKAGKDKAYSVYSKTRTVKISK